MDNQLILIADADAKNLQILKDNLEASGFLVSAVTNGKDAWEEILRTSPKLIISETNLPGLSGYQLLERINSDLKTSSIPLIFLTKQREVQQRIKGFEMGAKDYLVKPLHVKEVIAHIRMVLRRIEQRKIDQIETYNKFSGKLDQLALADLIESFGIERKTGILTVSNGKRTGQIFFREGSVVNANLEDFKTEQAVYQMLPWQTGYFNMIFRDVDVADKISISNLGLLLQGIKRLEIRQQLIKQLPSSETAFTVSPTFKALVEKKKVGNGAGSFIALLDGKRNVEQIVDESKLDDLIAIKRLVRLYQQGFIKPTIATKKQPAPLPKIIEPAEKVTFIKKHQIPLEMKFDKEIATPSLETSATNDYMLHEHTAKQEQKVQEFAQQEKTNVEPTPENKKIQENKIDTELMAQSTPVLKDKEKTGFPEDQIASSFNESDNENVFALKPPLKEKEIRISKEELLEKPVAENLKSSQNSTLEFQPPALNQLPPAFDNKISENNVFQIKPTKNQQDLEKEIIPLIERIEQESQPSSENEKEPDKQAAEPVIKEAASDASTNFEAPITPKDSKEKKFDDSDFTFIDEELLKQSSMQLKQELPETVELADSHQIISEFGQKAATPVATRLSTEQDKIVLISVDDDCKDEIMDILTNDNFKSINISAADGLKIDLGKIYLKAYSRFNLITASVEKNLNSFFRMVKQSIAGNIFVFDCAQPETWEYTSYLIHSIWFKFRIPYVIAVMNFKEQTSITKEVIRYKLDLKENVTMVSWDEVDKSIHEKLLQAVFTSTHPESLNASTEPKASPIQ